MLRPPLIAIAVLLLAPGVAHGATVRPYYIAGGSAVEFKAAPGEKNDLRIAWDGTTATFTDTRNRVAARAGRRSGLGRCQQVRTHTVRCAFERMAGPRVLLGDRDDRVKVTGETASLYGGS